MRFYLDTTETWKKRYNKVNGIHEEVVGKRRMFSKRAHDVIEVDECVRYIEINTLEELIEFYNQIGEEMVLTHFYSMENHVQDRDKKIPIIEIYNGYRE